MAYVGISHELLSGVKDKVRGMKDKERNAFAAPPQTLEVVSAPQEVIDLFWGEHAHLMRLLPEDWLVKNTAIDLNMFCDTEDGTQSRAIFTIKYSNPVYAPPNVSSYRHDITVPNDEFPIPQAEPYFKWFKEMTAIECRWAKVRNQIVDFLKSCKSLNEALKLWPDVRIYIPDEFIKRVERKVEREATTSRAAAALANVDTDAAISAAMTARLMGGMQGLT
jgi:hypothetical protein